MKKLLITGFDPFGGEKINPAWEAVKLLPDTLGEYTVYKLEIPTVFQKAGEKVLAEAQRLQPDVILCIGQAGGRVAVTPERVAVNVRDARIDDNEGNRPEDAPCVAGGPAAYFSTVPIKKMVAAMKDAGLPAAISDSAGTFVCNDVLYMLLHSCADSSVKVGFIHVPFLPEQGQPSLALEETVRGLQVAIGTL